MDLITIIMGLRNRTIEQVNDLRRHFQISNMTDAVVRAVRLTYMIATEMRNGTRIELHRTNGEVKQLIVIDPKTGKRVYK